MVDDKITALMVEAKRRVQSGWTQGALARGASGASVAFDSPDAAARSLNGAIGAAAGLRGAALHEWSGQKEYPLFLRVTTLMDAEAAALGYASASAFNDDPRTRQGAVLKLIAAAIRARKAAVS